MSPNAHRKSGFTLVELIIVIGIIGLLASVMLPALKPVVNKSRLVRATADLRSIYYSVQLYHDDFNSYPADADRSVPPGLESYLQGGEWPSAVWPGSVFDWDNWDDPDNPGKKIYQISIRFCPIGEPDECIFPNDDWAEDFDISSSVYYCISGACRSHINKPIDHPGYCINCP